MALSHSRQSWKSLFLSGAELLLWPLAVVLVWADFTLAENYAPLPSAFADAEIALKVFGYLSGRMLVFWAALFAVAGLAPRVFWKSDLRPVAFLAAVATLGGETSVYWRNFLATGAAPLALAVFAVRWAQGNGDAARRWLYRDAALGAGAAAAIGLVFLWAAHFPLRELAGLKPAAGFAVFLAGCCLAFAPAWRRAPSRWAAMGILIGLALFALPHSRRLFDENNRTVRFEELLGESPSPSTIILIVVDTLRADALSHRAADAPATPHIDALAAESVVFENAIAPSSWTFPAMTSMMTGLAPLSDVPAESLVYATPKRQTLAQYLQEAGYHTRAVLGNHLLYRPLNVADGFHQIETYADFSLGEREGLGDILSRRAPRDWVLDSNTARLTDQALGWIEASAGRPSFLWLHYFDPHDPYSPPEHYLRQEKAAKQDAGNRSHPLTADAEEPRELYNAEVRYIDDEIGRFLAELKRAGLYEDAMILFTSDHGEEFLEHGMIGHGWHLYQPVLHVPLTIRLPRGAVRRRVSSFVPTQAILPTLLDLAGIDAAKQPGWPQSLAPLLEPEGRDSYPAPIVSGANHSGPPQWTVVQDGFKYLRRGSGAEELYDLNSDPAEQNLLTDRPEILTRARVALDEHQALAQSILESEPLSESDAAEFAERLRSLGYIR